MNKFRRFTICMTTVCLLGLASLLAYAGENRYVRIINRASSPIQYLYASNVDTDSWQEDILGPWRMIASGYYVDVNIDDGSGHCLYDLKAVLFDGRKAITRNVNVCTQGSWTVTDGN